LRNVIANELEIHELNLLSLNRAAQTCMRGSSHVKNTTQKYTSNV
jgi:hypothetical protein